ncbi:MAG: class I SAM-dependent methyltransferase, partial [Actinobacteria bacterium]|nr:class I SAM-dependent methyltransferase [Actinomycetota bacterium]
REDPRLLAQIERALGDAQTVLNVGAGAGSYEPRDRQVLAVEPSSVMVAQRPASSFPAVRATADSLPFHTRSFDAAMTVLSLHHWHPDQEAGVSEMCRLARDRVVIVTIDPRPSGRMWLMRDYLHEVLELDHEIFPLPEEICEWLGGSSRIEVVPIPRDTPDWTLLSYWAHPHRVLDPGARAATSGFARQSDEVVERVVTDLRRDLENGTWHERNSGLANLDAYDCGLRLIVAVR